jgi:hypothetical protein
VKLGLTYGGKSILGAIENRVPRRIVGPKGGKDIGYWWESENERDQEDNIKLDLREIGWVGMYWVDLAEDTDQWRAVVNN